MSVTERETRSFTKNADSAPYIAIGLPVRKRSPVEFWMCLFQMLPPLNVKLGYMIQKADEANVKEGKLPAEARNELIEKALERNAKYIFLVDDDVLFPDITLYRMWVSMRKNPEIACITAVGGTKLTPSDPLIYQEGIQGAWWDWSLGIQVPIESAWAGCMLVNLDFVKKMKAPWFNDVVTTPEVTDERAKMNIWGHDRYFHKKLRTEAGGIILADTGLLVGHFDADLQKTYLLDTDSPPFRRPFEGETFIPFHDGSGMVSWKRIYVADKPDLQFKTYLEWLQAQDSGERPKISMLPEDFPKETRVEEKEGFTVSDSRRGDFSKWLKEVGAE